MSLDKATNRKGFDRVAVDAVEEIVGMVIDPVPPEKQKNGNALPFYSHLQMSPIPATGSFRVLAAVRVERCYARTHGSLENDMATQNKTLNPQPQQSKPPRVDEVAMQKHKAEEQEVAGRHKNDGQNDHKGNRRQPGSDRRG